MNITYRGRSSDVAQDIPEALSDDEIRRLAVEVVRSGELPRLRFPDIEPNAFRHFVVDRFGTSGSTIRIYLRPKVPFGQEAHRRERDRASGAVDAAGQRPRRVGGAASEERERG